MGSVPPFPSKNQGKNDCGVKLRALKSSSINSSCTQHCTVYDACPRRLKNVNQGFISLKPQPESLQFQHFCLEFRRGPFASCRASGGAPCVPGLRVRVQRVVASGFEFRGLGLQEHQGTT